MKHTVFVICAFYLAGCSKLTDVIDVAPPNNLDQGNVVRTADDARALVNGVHAQFHDLYYYMHTEMGPALLTGTMDRTNAAINIQYLTNDLTPTTTEVRNIWGAFYKMINHANWAIKLVSPLPESVIDADEKRKLVAQAKGLRALGHFDALRYYGEFYDLDSKFGIVLREEPGDYTNRYKARNTVAEVYNLILQDLDDAIQDGPDFTKPVLFSKTAAKALKARVYLYRGEYAQAAVLAQEVIEEGTRSLSPTFAEVFSTGFSSTEMILMRATDAVTAAQNERKRFTYTNGYAVTGDLLISLLDGDPRQPATYNDANKLILKVDNITFERPTYFIRLAEMYLIQAEALARSGASLEDAKAPLETIVSRAYGTPYASPATDTDELLDEIYEEIIKELCFENGAEWFASLRFDKIFDVKPTVTRTTQFIMPIPESEVHNNLLFGPQNPGY